MRPATNHPIRNHPATSTLLLLVLFTANHSCSPTDPLDSREPPTLTSSDSDDELTTDLRVDQADHVPTDDPNDNLSSDLNNDLAGDLNNDPNNDLAGDLNNDLNSDPTDALTTPCEAASDCEEQDLSAQDTELLDPHDQCQMISILFVCTGNTCRSPMALALFELAAEARGLDEHFKLASCGISAAAGEPAADDALEIIAAMGGDLSEHRSRACDDQLVEDADLIFCMTEAHVNTIRTRWPQSAEAVALMDPFGDIEDPWRQGREAYLRCVAQLERAIEDHLAGLR